jgi:signal transduction histidine kinase
MPPAYHFLQELWGVFDIHQVLNGFPGIAWTQNVHGVMEWSNETFQSYTGEAASMAGERYTARIHPDDHHRLLMTLLECARTGGWCPVRARIASRRGVYQWFIINIGYFPNPEDKTPYWLAVAFDTFDLRNTDDKLVDSEQRREKAVAEVRSMQRFIGIAGHELKTPVTSIKAYSELLRTHLNGTNLEATLVERLVGQTDHLAHLVDMLLDTTRISEDKLVLRRSWFDLDPLITDCLDSILQINGQRPIDFVRDEATTMIHADRERIRQVVINLLANAFKYSPPDTPIRIRLCKETTQIICRISNEGEGIPPDMQEKIFAPFAQAAEDRSGIGLGLYVSAQIIRSHGGRIGVESEPGKDTSFYFAVPV